MVTCAAPGYLRRYGAARLLGASVGSSFEHAGQSFMIVSLESQPEAAGDQHL
ncbi:MAG TPA: hypothetical protein VK524_33675 [Polyangiaceae bacterium]|nr:hypothetical protein [Polyangiaceae bacterium]